jgi:hypothetical protein
LNTQLQVEVPGPFGFDIRHIVTHNAAEHEFSRGARRLVEPANSSVEPIAVQGSSQLNRCVVFACRVSRAPDRNLRSASSTSYALLGFQKSCGLVRDPVMSLAFCVITRSQILSADQAEAFGRSSAKNVLFMLPVAAGAEHALRILTPNATSSEQTTYGLTMLLTTLARCTCSIHGG